MQPAAEQSLAETSRIHTKGYQHNPKIRETREVKLLHPGRTYCDHDGRDGATGENLAWTITPLA